MTGLDRIVAIDARYMGLQTDGIGRYSLNLLRGIVEARPDFKLHLLVARESDLPPAVANSDIFQLEVLPRSPRTLTDQLLLPRFFKRRGISVIHSVDPYAPFLSRCRRIITIHDLIPIICRNRLTHSLKAQWWRLWRLWLTAQYRAATRVIAVSQHSADDVRRVLFVDGSNIQVIHNGICLHGPSSASAPSEISGKPYLLYVGRRDPHKNLVGLITAFDQIRKTFPELRLVIAGAPNPRYPQAEDLARELLMGDAIHFIGHVDEGTLDALYRGAKLFVFPSLYEGFGLPPLEAMARGVPVVASDSAAIPEVLGDSALLCDAGNPLQLAQAIEKVLSDAALSETLRNSGLQRAAQFTAKRQAEMTLRLYEEVARK